MEARLRLSVLIGGFAASQMLYVAARLKLADLLAGGPMTAADLARECGAKEAPLRRVVRGLAAFGVFEIQEDGRFANNWLSECLRAGAQDSLREMALLYGEEHYHAMSELLQAVRRGGTAFEHAYRKPHFTYLASNPDAARSYYEAQSTAAAGSAAAVVSAYDFSRAGIAVDVGGGTGQLIRAVLHANPGVSGILVESAGMARKARARLHAEGLDGRCEVQTGDIFESLPGDGDVYLLGHVLHGLDDQRAEQLLRNCHRAMGPRARLLVIERVLEEQPATGLTAQHAAVFDAVAMAVSGGRERTVEEHSSLLSGAGMKVIDVTAVGGGDSIVEAARRD
jgi:ubiquinone/menaquinone biosynthesis C-methylase UbiE